MPVRKPDRPWYHWGMTHTNALRAALACLLGAAAAAPAAGGLVLLGRIAAEVEADRQHVSGG